jgi:hypothetical protein
MIPCGTPAFNPALVTIYNPPHPGQTRITEDDQIRVTQDDQIRETE